MALILSFHAGSPQLDYNQLCGQERLWSFERVLDSFLEGHDNKTFPNVDKRADCLKLCLAETEFVCRCVALRGSDDTCAGLSNVILCSAG